MHSKHSLLALSHRFYRPWSTRAPWVSLLALVAGCSDAPAPGMATAPADTAPGTGAALPGSMTPAGTPGGEAGVGETPVAPSPPGPADGATPDPADGSPAAGDPTDPATDPGGTPAAGDPATTTDPATNDPTAGDPAMPDPVTPDPGVDGLGDQSLPPSRPVGNIPSTAYPESMVNLPEAQWADGLISPTLANTHDNQPMVVNGYLQLTGNAGFSTYDLQDPTNPELLAARVSPDNCDTCGPAGEGEAEGHQVGFAKYGDQFYTATISGVGIDVWNISNAADPQYVQSVPIEGVNFGDFTEAVWGIAWQGETIYIGATNGGLFVLDASDPTNVTQVNRLPTSAYGGVSAGPLYAVGNILVITTPKESGGIATLDISDPHNPLPLDAIQTSASYIGALYGHHLYLQSPLRVWDVLSDPTTIGDPNAPLGTLETLPSEYMSFSDGYMFLGLLRPDPGAVKIDVSNPPQMVETSRIWGRLDLAGNDDQFTIAVGNLLVLSDDQLLSDGSGRVGSVIAVHDAAPDTVPPAVDTVIPRDGATGQSTQSRIGLSFTDNIELATLDLRSLVVRPVGGGPIDGTWGVYATVVNFDPVEDLLPGTTYEVVLPAGRITDYVGNGIAEDFVSTFTTR